MTRTYPQLRGVLAYSEKFESLLLQLRRERQAKEKECKGCAGSGYSHQYDVDDFGTCAKCQGAGTIERKKP